MSTEPGHDFGAGKAACHGAGEGVASAILKDENRGWEKVLKAGFRWAELPECFEQKDVAARCRNPRATGLNRSTLLARLTRVAGQCDDARAKTETQHANI